MCTLWYRAPELLMGLEYGKPMDIWSAGSIFYELIVGRPAFVYGSEKSDVDMSESIARCFKPVTDGGSSQHQSSAYQRRGALEPPEGVNKLKTEFVELYGEMMTAFKRNLSKLNAETAHEILRGCLCPLQGRRINLDALLAAGGRLLADVKKHVYGDITGQQHSGTDTYSLFSADSGVFGPPRSLAGDLSRIAGAPLPSKMERKKESVLAIPAGLFNSGSYHKGRRRAEWQQISQEGGAKAEAWQKLRVCRCHGQCGAREHKNRRKKLCQNEGTHFCRDVYKGFSYYLCAICCLRSLQEAARNRGQRRHVLDVWRRKKRRSRASVEATSGESVILPAPKAGEAFTEACRRSLSALW